MDRGVCQGEASQFKELVCSGWFWLSTLKSTGSFDGNRDKHFSVKPGSEEG
jgi:hypothetical protein